MIKPVVGNWYQDSEQRSIFEVVAYDEEEQTVEIQHLDGEVEEYDLDTSQELSITGIEPPEDWRPVSTWRSKTPGIPTSRCIPKTGPVR